MIWILIEKSYKKLIFNILYIKIINNLIANS